MKWRSLVIFATIYQLSCFSNTQAQQFSDSLNYKESVSNLYRKYIDGIGDNAQIYHGIEYIRNGQKANGFPYYEKDSMGTGTISYRGTVYENQKFFYNLVSDDIIIYNYQRNALIGLLPENVDSFSIGSHVYLYILAVKSKGLPRNGFYEKLFDGEPGLYARREKKLYNGTGSEEAKYIQYNTYYIKLKDEYYIVDGKNSMIDILKDQRDALKKYIRINKLNFKKDPENSLLLSTTFYYRLKN